MMRISKLTAEQRHALESLVHRPGQRRMTPELAELKRLGLVFDVNGGNYIYSEAKEELAKWHTLRTR